MIELVSHERCITCQTCVTVCPENVFDRVPHEPPVIARPDDCQTCFLCELYCPTDALYVSPLSDAHEFVDEKRLVALGLLGSFQRAMGWTRGLTAGTDGDLSFRMFEDGRVAP